MCLGLYRDSFTFCNCSSSIIQSRIIQSSDAMIYTSGISGVRTNKQRALCQTAKPLGSYLFSTGTFFDRDKAVCREAHFSFNLASNFRIPGAQI